MPDRIMTVGQKNSYDDLVSDEPYVQEIEKATSSDINTGTDNKKYVTSSAIFGSNIVQKSISDAVLGIVLPGISGSDISSIASAPEGFTIVSNDNSLGINGSLAIWHNGQMRLYWCSSDISTYVIGQLTPYQLKSDKNTANGYAGLDSSTKLLPAQIPAFSGDVVTDGVTTITTISANAVDFSKVQQISTGKLLGRSTALTGNIEQIAVGSGLSLSAGTLSIVETGTVASVSVSSVNGFSGTVATPTTTPNISLSTTVTGVLKGSGGSLVAATDADISGKLITGYVSGTGTVAATDTILQAINKLNGNNAFIPSVTAVSLVGNPTGVSANSSFITLGAGLSFSGTTLVATGSGGTVTTASVVTANGFQGSVATATTTPAITLQTSVSGVLKGSANALVAATDADITSKLITGFSSSSGTVAATDTILQALNKLNGNDALRALDSAVVHNTGNETVAGIKNLTSFPKIPITSIVNVSAAGSNTNNNGSATSPYQTLDFALTQITTASVSNPFCINLAPGTYTITGNLPLKPNVSIVGNGAIVTVTGNLTIDAGFLSTNSNSFVRDVIWSIAGTINMDFSTKGASLVTNLEFIDNGCLQSSTLAGTIIGSYQEYVGVKNCFWNESPIGLSAQAISLTVRNLYGVFINNKMSSISSENTGTSFNRLDVRGGLLSTGMTVKSTSSGFQLAMLRGIGNLQLTADGTSLAVSTDYYEGLTLLNGATEPALIQQLPASSFIANPVGSTATAVAATLGAGLAFSGTTLVATGAGSITTIIVRRFTASGTYVPTVGMKYAVVEVQGAGGGGGGAPATAATSSSAGAGGGAGAYAKDTLTAAQIGSSQVVTIASGANSNSGIAGSGAGNTSFGSLVTAGGGNGGGVAASSTTFIRASPNATSPTSTATNAGALLLQGQLGSSGLGYGNNFGAGGDGGVSIWGGKSPIGGYNFAGNAGSGFGSGGGGAGNGASASAAIGSAGLPGLIIVTEYIGP